MGFPYEEASWSVVDGAMFIGWQTAIPGFCTFLAAVICAGVLIYGQITESKKTKAFDE